MTEPINMLDDEYCTPAQRAELRRMREELPLWQEMLQTPHANVDVDPHAIDCFSTEGAKVDTDKGAFVMGVPSEFSAWLDDVELHRLINETVGEESEE